MVQVAREGVAASQELDFGVGCDRDRIVGADFRHGKVIDCFARRAAAGIEHFNAFKAF
jgi:hypothetical protein